MHLVRIGATTTVTSNILCDVGCSQAVGVRDFKNDWVFTVGWIEKGESVSLVVCDSMITNRGCIAVDVPVPAPASVDALEALFDELGFGEDTDTYDAEVEDSFTKDDPTNIASARETPPKCLQHKNNNLPQSFSDTGVTIPNMMKKQTSKKRDNTNMMRVSPPSSTRKQVCLYK